MNDKHSTPSAEIVAHLLLSGKHIVFSNSDDIKRTVQDLKTNGYMMSELCSGITRREETRYRVLSNGGDYDRLCVFIFDDTVSSCCPKGSEVRYEDLCYEEITPLSDEDFSAAFAALIGGCFERGE